MDDNFRDVADELLDEGKKVCFLPKGDKVIAAAGCRD